MGLVSGDKAKNEVAKKRQKLVASGFVVPSPAQVTAARTPNGGWTRAVLASWGVPWPPPRGWRKELTDAWAKESST